MHPERLTPIFEPANIQGKRQQVLGNWVELDEGGGHDGPFVGEPSMESIACTWTGCARSVLCIQVPLNPVPVLLLLRLLPLLPSASLLTLVRFLLFAT